MRNKLTPLPEARAGNSARECCDLNAVIVSPCPESKQLGVSKCLCHYGEKCSAWTVNLPSMKGVDLARWVTLLDEPPFCFSYKWLGKFCKEM